MSFPVKILEIEDSIYLQGVDLTTMFANLSVTLSTLSTTDTNLQNQINGINLLLTSDNINLDTVQELVDALELLQTGFSALIVNDLTTGGTTKALSAAQGVVLKGLIDALTSVVSGKQDTLVSGVNIRTINGQNLLGGGDVTITAGGLNNVEFINSISDLPAPIATVRTFLPDTIYFFNTGTFDDTNTWVLQHNTHIFGLGKTNTLINFNVAGNAITYTNATVILRDLEIQTPSGSVFDVTNTTAFHTYIERVNFRGCLSLGTINGGGLFKDWVLINSCTTGMTISGAMGSIILNICSHRPMSGGAGSYGLRILNGTTATSFRCYGGIFDVATTHYGIYQVGTFTFTAKSILSNNIFSGAGTFLQGFSHITTNWEFNSNVGIANERQEQSWNAYVIAGMTLTSPTVANAAAYATLGSTGGIFLAFSGGANQDDGAGFTFQVPSDYFGGGNFQLVGTSVTNANNIKMFLGISKVPVGENFATLDESPLSVVMPAATQYNRIVDGIITPTTVFAPGDIIVVKIWRDPDNAQDTANVDYYLNSIQFNYDAV